jgi:molecular chaperone GrpE
MPENDAQTQEGSFGRGDADAAPQSGREPPVGDVAAELASMKDRLLRSLAEQENIRGQLRRDRDEAVKYAASGFAGDLLSSVDNLERAIASVPEDKRAEPTVAGLLAGVEATRRALLDTFARHGLKRLDPIGEPFDPHRHEAGFEADDARYPPGTVTTVIQPGYMHHDRLLRPALVGVRKMSAMPQEDAPDPRREAPPKAGPS